MQACVTINQLIHDAINGFMMNHDEQWLADFTKTDHRFLSEKYPDDIPNWSRVNGLSFLTQSRYENHALIGEFNRMLMEQAQDALWFKRNNYALPLLVNQSSALGGQMDDKDPIVADYLNFQLSMSQKTYVARLLWEDTFKSVVVDGKNHCYVDFLITQQLANGATVSATLPIMAVSDNGFETLVELKWGEGEDAPKAEDFYGLTICNLSCLKLHHFKSVKAEEKCGSTDKFSIYQSEDFLQHPQGRVIVDSCLAYAKSLVETTPASKIEVRIY